MDDRVCCQAAKHGHSSSRTGSLLDCSLPLLSHKEKRGYRLWGGKGGWGRIKMCPSTHLAMSIHKYMKFISVYTCPHAQLHTDATFQFKINFTFTILWCCFLLVIIGL